MDSPHPLYKFHYRSYDISFVYNFTNTTTISAVHMLKNISVYRNWVTDLTIMNPTAIAICIIIKYMQKEEE